MVHSYLNQLIGVLQEQNIVSIIVYEQYAVLFGATIVHELEYNESVARIKKIISSRCVRDDLIEFQHFWV